MAPRSTPTARQRRFGAEVRRMREGADVTIQQAADMLGCNRTVISNIESGRFGISEERLRTLACHYECPDPSLVDALAAMTGGRSKGEWWEEYRGKLPPGFLDISEAEHHAVRIRTAQTIHMPGLLQTEEHARALFDLVAPPLPRLQVELRVAHRLQRRAVLERERPTPYVGIIHEAALRMRFGSRRTARAQLDYLVERSECDHISLRVIPFEAGGFTGAGQSILLAEGSVPQLDVVHVDATHGPIFLDSPTQLSNYRGRLDLMEKMALPEKPSRDFIRNLAKNL